MNQKQPLENDSLTRKIIEKAGVEEPSWNFTSALMEKIRTSLHPEVFIYRPVISRWGWFWIAVAIISICLLVVFIPSSQQGHAYDYSMLPGSVRSIMDNSRGSFTDFINGFVSIPILFGILFSVMMLVLSDRLMKKGMPAK